MAEVELLRAIGSALGQSGPYVERTSPPAEVIFLGTGTSPPTGASLEVIGGAVSGDERVAWIEQRSEEMIGEGLPIEIDVRLAWGGQLRHQLPLETYNPFFGCRLLHAKWYGDDFVYLYSEKHQTILARLSSKTGRQRLAFIEQPACFAGDVLWYRHRTWPALLFGRRLPTLTATRPIFAPWIPIDKFYEAIHLAGDDRLGLGYAKTVYVPPEAPTPAATIMPLPPKGALSFARDPLPFKLRLRERLVGVGTPQFGADVLIETLARPFFQDVQPETSTTYSSFAGVAHDHGLGVELYAVLEKTAPDRAQAWLRGLESLLPSAPSPTGWPPARNVDDGLLQMALAQIRERVPGMLAACAGTGPRDHPGYRNLRVELSVPRLEGYVEAIELIAADRLAAKR